MKNDESKLGAIYVRVSTDDQVEYSPSSQLKLILNYAKNNNIEILDEFIFKDEGISGRKTDKRTSFNKMISLAKTKPKPFDVILVYDFSRFARNREDSIIFKNMLRKKLNIDVISITQPLADDKNSVIFEAIFEAMDEYYSLNLAENVKRGKQEKASRGEWSGRIPYGYNFDSKNKTLTINKKESDILKKLAKIYIKEQKFEPVVDYILENNIRSRKGIIWGTNEVQALLSNSTYNGILKCGNFKGNGLHPKIFDDDAWNKIQKVMKINAKTTFKAKRPLVKYDHWLRGLVYCSSCGRVLCVRKGGGDRKPNSGNILPYPFLQCCGYQHRTCKVSQYIQIFKMEKYLLNELEKTFKEKLEINIVNIESDSVDELEKLNVSLKRMNNRLKRIKTSYMDGIDTLEEYKFSKNKVLQEKELLEKQITNFNKEHTSESKINEVYNNCQEYHKILSDKKAPQDIKYKLAHLLFDKITWNREEKTLTITYK